MAKKANFNKVLSEVKPPLFCHFANITMMGFNRISGINQLQNQRGRIY
jgi:hypothetical protein